MKTISEKNKKQNQKNPQQLLIGHVNVSQILVATVDSDDLLVTDGKSLLSGLYIPGFVWLVRFLSPLKILLPTPHWLCPRFMLWH